MLSHLHIRNYAIIESAEIDLNPHLNVIIGETGAGKSILMGALNLVLGSRADTSVLMDKEEKCVVEAQVQISAYHLRDFFEENDLDYADTTIIRREINPKGKSRAFINDIPVTLDVLKALTSQLIDIHSQNENSDLLNEDFFIRILDKISNNSMLASYTHTYQEYQASKKQLKTFKDEAAAFAREYEFIKFQYEELDVLPLSVEQWKETEEELSILENAGTIRQNLQACTGLLSDQEINIEDLIAEIQKLLSPIAGFHSELQGAAEEIDEIQIRLRSLVRQFKSLLNNIDTDENRLQELSALQSSVNRLMQKHHVKDMEALIDLHRQLKDKLGKFSFSEETISALEEKVSHQLQLLRSAGEQITALRQACAQPFTTAISALLKDLGMPFARVELRFEITEQPCKDGFDRVTLLFAPNKGSQLQSLQHVGSGGEKSRLMLAIKSMVAKETALPTLIFDEIDTGISGEVALKTGELLRQISSDHQVITITHLPQVAAAGRQHFLVYKKHLEDKSVTRIDSLDAERTVTEIAKMLSGENPSQAALENARILLKRQ